MDYGERVRLGYCDPEDDERSPRLRRSRGRRWRSSTIREVAAQRRWRRRAAEREAAGSVWCADDTGGMWFIDDDDIPF